MFSEIQPEALLSTVYDQSKRAYKLRAVVNIIELFDEEFVVIHNITYVFCCYCLGGIC